MSKTPHDVSIASVTVMGARVAGLCAALMLARDGQRVTVLERDWFEVGLPGEAPRWLRKGVPHFLQPHAFIPRGRAELREYLADVYAALLAAGPTTSTSAASSRARHGLATKNCSTWLSDARLSSIDG
jgi:hypothetical protein